jgi:2-polyprenyl-6-methoxyphenol hydroxylase-like FAD-dependent oxidoreductase
VGLSVVAQKLRAPLLIGADGSHSSTREQLGMELAGRSDRFGIRAHFTILLPPARPSRSRNYWRVVQKKRAVYF